MGRRLVHQSRVEVGDGINPRNWVLKGLKFDLASCFEKVLTMDIIKVTMDIIKERSKKVLNLISPN